MKQYGLKIAVAALCAWTGAVHGVSSETGWQDTAYSIAAGQSGVVNAYRMEDELIWRRIDDNRFSSFKTMARPDEEGAWWVKTLYRSDVFPNYGGTSLSQSYSGMQLGYETGRDSTWRGGSVRKGFFYTMNSSDAYANAGNYGVPYGSASSFLKSYGAAWYASWEPRKNHRFEGVFRLSNVKNRLAYTDFSGAQPVDTYSTWMTALGLRWYTTRFVSDKFFWEPQVGFSLGYMDLPSVGTETVYTPKDKALMTGKVGLMAGRTYKLGGNPGLAYGRVSLQKDFSGPFEGTGKERQDGSSTTIAMGNGQSQRYDMTVGTSYAMGTGNNLWGEVTRRFGSDMKNDWYFSGGLVLRWGGAGKKERERFEELKKDDASLEWKEKDKKEKDKKQDNA